MWGAVAFPLLNQLELLVDWSERSVCRVEVCRDCVDIVFIERTR
jgi:hypothetical protein